MVTEMCNYSTINPRTFYHPEKKLHIQEHVSTHPAMSMLALTPPLPLPTPGQPLNYTLSLQICLLGIFQENGIAMNSVAI